MSLKLVLLLTSQHERNVLQSQLCTTNIVLKSTILISSPTLEIDHIVIWVKEPLCVNVTGEFCVLQYDIDIVLQFFLSFQDEVSVYK